ncbi:MAG: thioredoxin family protein, partial [Candidatus Hodarchaeales archaeon]
MIENSKLHKLVLIYDETKDDFRPASDSALFNGNITFVIDENEKKSKLILPKGTKMILQKTIERRVLSYLRSGYPLDDEGLRIGANFKFEVTGSQEFAQDQLVIKGKEQIQKDFNVEKDLKSPIDYSSYFNKGKNYNDYVDSILDEDRKSKYNSYFKRFELQQNHKEFLLNDLEHDIKILAIGASWCSDCQNNLPIISHIADFSPKLELRLINKEGNEGALNFVNKGHRIPQIFFLSPDFYKVESWAERPTEQYRLYGSLRRILGWDDPDFYKEYRKTYA